MSPRSVVNKAMYGFKQVTKRITPAVVAGVIMSGLFANTVLPFLPQPAIAQASTGLRIVENQLYKDGKPFLPRGFNSIGLLTPEWCTKPQGVAARTNFGQTTMDIAKSWNANTLRFQMSQRGLTDLTLTDEQRAAYLLHVQEGVALARANGFAVILSMQEQTYGCGYLDPLPSAQTIEAWSIVAGAFKSDPYIMFELFNEPNIENDAAGWEQWRNGGTTPVDNNGRPAVGHQALVEHLRSLGATNVLIADGARKAARLSGLPFLNDPDNQLMYGIHPYYFSPGEAWWYEQYGYLDGVAPVIATEWNYLAAACGTTSETLAPSLFQYLVDRRIGLLGHAIDTPGVTVADWAGTPTECGTQAAGSGKALKDFFATQSDSDVVAPSAPTNVAAIPDSHNVVRVYWDTNSETDIAGYQVLRDGTLIASTVDAFYTDQTVSAQTTYTYEVRAVDIADNVSAPSAPATATTPEAPDTTAPTAPGNLRVYIANPTNMQLSWDASTDDKGVMGYRIVRDNLTTLATVAQTTYTDSTMAPGQTHTYDVAALDAAGNLSSESSITVTIPAEAANGLRGTYFDTTNFGNQKLTRVDNTINFAWGTGSPSSKIGSDTFSARWTGKIIPVANETYTLYTQSDDGVRLWVNGQLLIDNWTSHGLTEDVATIFLSANQAYDIKLEYYENKGNATMKLLWSSPSIPKQVIPSNRLLAQ